MNIRSCFQQLKKLFSNFIRWIKKIFSKNTDIKHQSSQQSSEPQVRCSKIEENIDNSKSDVGKMSNDLNIDPPSLPTYPSLGPDISLQSTSNISPYCPTVNSIFTLKKNAEISCEYFSLTSLAHFSLTSNDGVKIYSLSKPFHFDKVTTLNKIDNSCVYFGKVTEINNSYIYCDKVTKIDNSYTYNIDSKLWSHHSIKAVSTFNQAKPATYFQCLDYYAHNSSYHINPQVTDDNHWVFEQGESSLTSFITSDNSLCDENEEECPDCIYQKEYENGSYPAIRFDSNGKVIETFCNKHGQNKPNLYDINIWQITSQQSLV
ncbi:hypothetical protein [Candidatus Mesenet endosymbiont of Agriotes lineatus]|uniref:hypothetical protein n=1 Tax=Candidatus Mesenet endosymbiont of Agriotes lineatus TaxID=3077948 RepID=UPI0030D34087